MVKEPLVVDGVRVFIGGRGRSVRKRSGYGGHVTVGVMPVQ